MRKNNELICVCSIEEKRKSTAVVCGRAIKREDILRKFETMEGNITCLLRKHNLSILTPIYVQHIAYTFTYQKIKLKNNKQHGDDSQKNEL